MNCKPNDVAVIVSAPGPQTMFMVGHILRVTKMVFDGEPCWEYEGPRIETGLGLLDVVEDEFLRPIKGDDVTDEEVRDLYSPSPQVQIAEMHLREIARVANTAHTGEWS